jgi:hypothetical protein
VVRGGVLGGVPPFKLWLPWLRAGNGGAGRPAVVVVEPGETDVPRLSLRGGALSRSSGLAPGTFPTRLGGGSNVLTSLVLMVAKYRGCGRSVSASSLFPATGTCVEFTTLVSGCLETTLSLGSEFIRFCLQGIEFVHACKTLLPSP